MKQKLVLIWLLCCSASFGMVQLARATGSQATLSPLAFNAANRDTEPHLDAASLVRAPANERGSNALPPPTEFVITNASKQHDFRVLMTKGCNPLYAESDICDGEATLSIFAKGNTTEKQRLTLKNLSVIRLGNTEVLVNTAELNDYQGSLVVDDFNFDGHEDLAFQVGQDGPYGAATFQVFLYQARQGLFKLSKPLSALTEENLGLFRLDRSRKRLETFNKSGCCFHVTQEYEFVGSNPVVVARYTEDAMSVDGYVTETVERLVNGRWVRRIHRERLSEFGADW